MQRFGLRLRVFLFFALLVAGAVVIAAGAMTLGWSRADPSMPAGPFVTALIAFALVNTALLVGVWLLFDENVAKPINRLSADLRLRVRSDAEGALDVEAARYLGDLAPAAAALSQKAASGVEATAQRIARETERLSTEHKRLAALLTESPIATILLNPMREIVLYDAQAAAVLSEIATPRLRGPLSDYFDMESVDAAINELSPLNPEIQFELVPATDAAPLSARVKTLDDDGHMVFIDPPQGRTDQVGQRPLVFDFDLMTTSHAHEIRDTDLFEMCFVVLDLETTGLSVATDAIIQIGAVRVLNGTIVAAEEVSTYVNPGRPIPAASTRVHKITDDHVKDAPEIKEAGQKLHHFARDAVLVAHNAPFDIGLLKRHSGEIGASWDHPVLDTVLLSAVAFGTTDDHSLDGICERLSIEIPPEDRHTALGDARATAAVLIKLLGIVESRGYKTFGELEPELARQARRLYSKS